MTMSKLSLFSATQTQFCLYSSLLTYFIPSFLNNKNPTYIPTHTCIKGTHCLGSGELVFERRLKTICNKMHGYGWKDVLKVEYNDPRNNYASKLHSSPYTNTARRFVDSTKRPNIMVLKIKGKPRNFEAFCGCILLKNLLTNMHFIPNGIQTPFIDQLSVEKDNFYTLWERLCPEIVCTLFGEPKDSNWSNGSVNSSELKQDRLSYFDFIVGMTTTKPMCVLLEAFSKS